MRAKTSRSFRILRPCRCSVQRLAACLKRTIIRKTDYFLDWTNYVLHAVPHCGGDNLRAGAYDV